MIIHLFAIFLLALCAAFAIAVMVLTIVLPLGILGRLVGMVIFSVVVVLVYCAWVTATVVIP